MCTVSFVPINDGYLLTSSRDEKILRPTQMPLAHTLAGTTIEVVYPKDLKSGGTWIALNPTEKRLACLLNGAYENHEKKANYRKSRGQILLDNFLYPNAEVFQEHIDLTDIEPFTLLIIENKNDVLFSELRWDGTQKYFSRIDATKPQIWSSATLYDRENRAMREQWFRGWISENDVAEIAKFHKTKHGDDFQNDILMHREDGLQTLCVSQIKYQIKTIIFEYHDLLNGEIQTLNFSDSNIFGGLRTVRLIN